MEFREKLTLLVLFCLSFATIRFERRDLGEIREIHKKKKRKRRECRWADDWDRGSISNYDVPQWIYLTCYFSRSSWHSQGHDGPVLIERFPVTDPRSERISAGPRRALHERAQQHYIGGGTEKTIVLKQAALADEQHRIRRQQSRRADHTRDRRGKAVEPQSYRDRRLEWEKNDANSVNNNHRRPAVLYSSCVCYVRSSLTMV